LVNRGNGNFDFSEKLLLQYDDSLKAVGDFDGDGLGTR
jgi:hypothetical protein